MGRPVSCKHCSYEWHHEDDTFRKIWFNDYRRCPECKVLYCDLPLIGKEKIPTEKTLMELQDIYLINRSEYIYCLMWDILYQYAISMIKSGPIYKIDRGQLNNYARSAVLLFTLYYKKDKNFKVIHSFGGLLRHKVNESCFSKKERMIDASSLNYKLSDGNEVEYKDEAPQIDYIKKVEQDYDKVLLYKKLEKIIEDYDEYDTNEEKFLSYIGLYFYFCHSETKSGMFYRILEDAENKKRILKNKKYKKYNKVPEKKRGKVGKFHFTQIKDRLRDALLGDIED